MIPIRKRFAVCLILSFAVAQTVCFAQTDSADRAREEEINAQLRELARCEDRLEMVLTAYGYRTTQVEKYREKVKEAKKSSWLTWLLHRRRELTKLSDILDQNP